MGQFQPVSKVGGSIFQRGSILIFSTMAITSKSSTMARFRFKCVKVKKMNERSNSSKRKMYFIHKKEFKNSTFCSGFLNL